MLRARVFFYCLCIVLKLSHLHTYLVFNFFGSILIQGYLEKE